MITRTYKKACEHCNATGKVPADGNTTIAYEICPVCNGTKTILVTEFVTESDFIINKDILLT